MGRVLAIDYGRKRTGVAITDESRIAINQLPILATHEPDFFDKLTAIIREYSPSVIVLGFPYSEHEELTPVQNEILQFKNRLEKNFSIEVTLFDESHTSLAAEEVIHAISGKKSLSKKKREKKKATLDSVAAGVILQGFLNSVG